MSNTRYLLENNNAEAARRFELLSALYNPNMFRQFDACGMAVGLDCWEVGAGGPTLMSMIARASGRTFRLCIGNRYRRLVDDGCR